MNVKILRLHNCVFLSLTSFLLYQQQRIRAWHLLKSNSVFFSKTPNIQYKKKPYKLGIAKYHICNFREEPKKKHILLSYISNIKINLTNKKIRYKQKKRIF